METPKTLTPGWKTSEFWITVLTQAAAIGTAVAGLLPEKYAVLLVAFSQAAYTISRGIAKSAQAPK